MSPVPAPPISTLALPWWEPRVLVVDDDPVVRLAATKLLERLGLTVEVAADGAEALRMSAGWPYVAIFMDCYMPGVDGYETTREIQGRADASTRPVIVAVTSRPRHVCIAAGMDHYIAKPVRLDVLERECRALGLIAPAEAGGAAALAAADKAIAVAGQAPVLAAAALADPAQAGERALGLAGRARACLPRLWRAANTADGDVLRRVAEELLPRARAVGAERLTALLEAVAASCRAGQPEVAARIEPAVRAELAQLEEVAQRALAGDGAGAVSAAAPVAAAAPSPDRLVRVAVADDDPLARTAIEAMIRRGEGLELVASAAGAEEIVQLAAELEPDVVVVDFAMPGGGGPVAARRIRERRPATQVVALTASESPETYLAVLEAGATGLLVKGSPPSRLVELLHRAAGRAAG